MEYIIHGRRPEQVFRFFEEISAIPRGSFHEEGIAAYLMEFASARGLEAYRDGMNNVFIRMPATKGLEQVPAILLQGHTDMVCEKNRDVEHDFLKDPLRLRLDGKYLRATGTTLGADNGIAVAVMMAILDGAMEAHPAFECLFTTAEEVGLNGAHAFDYSRVKARRMINMDSEEQGIVTVGCAGGLRSELVMCYQAEECAAETLRVRVEGLMGGHSGVNINGGRANANKLMGRLLSALAEKEELRLCRLEGGSKDNAIPRECEARIAVTDGMRAVDILTEEAERIAKELSADDRGFTVVCETVESDGVAMSVEKTKKAVALLACVANGVMKMSQQVEGLVEYSRNLGVIEWEEGKLRFVFSSRSSLEGQLDDSIRELDLLAALTGCQTKHYSRYPGWAYAPVSPLRDAYLAAYKAKSGKEAKVEIIHAGLECGVISSHVPDMDMISIGPDMRDIHSPDEALDLDSVEDFWELLTDLIGRL